MAVVPQHGIQLQLSDMQTAPTFTSVALLVSLTPPNPSRSTTDIPSHDDTGGMPFQFDALYNPGECVAVMQHDPADGSQDPTTGVREAFNDGAIRDWKIIYPGTAVTYDFSGYVISWDPEPVTPNDDVIRVGFTIKLSGDITES